jgi:drug/metabolite transporter (DMT)-like permease
MNAPHGSAIWLAGLGAVLFSAKAIVVKLCYRHGAPVETVLALRMLFALPLFWGAVWWQSVTRRPPPLARRDVWQLLGLGFVGYYVSSYLDFLGLQYVSAGLERIILYLYPTVVLLVSAVALGKPIARRQWLAMAVAYLGVLLVFVHDVRLDGQHTALGSGLVLASACTYALYLIMTGELVARVGSLRLVAYASGSATVFCVAQALLVDAGALVRQPAAVYGLSVVNASLCTFVPMLLIALAVSRIGSGLTAQSGVVGPVATVAFGWWFLGESVGALQVLGILVVLGSMALLAAPARPPLAAEAASGPVSR